MKIVLTIGLLFLSSSVYAALTETKSCDTCDYSDSVNIAKIYYKKPTCQVIGLNDGNSQFGSTTYQCASTSTNIIVTNPLSRTAFKFKISATQQSQFSDAQLIKATDLSLTNDERNALEEFYDIDYEFRRGVQEAGSLHTSLASTQRHSTSNLKKIKGLEQISSQSNESCESHPANYITDESFQRFTHRELNNQIANKIGDQSWTDLSHESLTSGGGLQISANGAGVNITLHHNNIGVFANIFYGGNADNNLSFNVSYGGEANVNGRRVLALSFELNRGASQIDGFPIGRFMSGVPFDAKINLVSNCLLDALERGGDVEIEHGESGGSTGPGGNNDGSIWLPSTGSGCTKTIKYKTCSTAHGTTSCTLGSITARC